MDHEHEIAALKHRITALENALKEQFEIIKMLASDVPMTNNKIGCLNHLVGALVAEIARSSPDPMTRAEEIICFHETSIFGAIAAMEPGQPGLDEVNREREEQLAIVFAFARSTAKLIAAMR